MQWAHACRGVAHAKIPDILRKAAGHGNAKCPSGSIDTRINDAFSHDSSWDTDANHPTQASTTIYDNSSGGGDEPAGIRSNLSTIYLRGFQNRPS